MSLAALLLSVWIIILLAYNYRMFAAIILGPLSDSELKVISNHCFTEQSVQLYWRILENTVVAVGRVAQSV